MTLDLTSKFASLTWISIAVHVHPAIEAAAKGRECWRQGKVAVASTDQLLSCYHLQSELGTLPNEVNNSCDSKDDLAGKLLSLQPLPADPRRPGDPLRGAEEDVHGAPTLVWSTHLEIHLLDADISLKKTIGNR